jgi:hypothetical protein
VAANDLYDGLTSVSNAFVGTTLTALDELQQLHTYLLIASIALFVGLVVIMLMPYQKRLVMESVRLAGLLSQLPQVRCALMSSACARGRALAWLVQHASATGSNAVRPQGCKCSSRRLGGWDPQPSASIADACHASGTDRTVQGAAAPA